MPREVAIENIAREFHDAQARLLHEHKEVRSLKESRMNWSRIPEPDRKIMMAIVRSLLTDEIIEPGRNAL
jgi:hypothetical protein